jgi:hypothetical protein
LRAVKGQYKEGYSLSDQQLICQVAVESIEEAKKIH